MFRIKAIRIANVGHVIFAVVMVVLGVLGLISGDFAPIWQPSPKNIPERELLVYGSALISLLCGVGLLWPRTASWAGRMLLIYLLIWLLLFRVVHILVVPVAQDSWSGFGETATIVAGAWVLYAWFASEWDKRRVAFAIGNQGVRIARVLFGVALVIFGIAHFNYLKDTATLVPTWLSWHLGWAYFFGCTFIAAGIAVIIGVYGRLASALSVVQLGLFTLLVWAPFIAKGFKPFEWSEFLISVTVTAGAWVVAESYKQRPNE